MNQAQLEHRLGHVEQALRRLGARPSREPLDPERLQVLVREATDDELRTLEQGDTFERARVLELLAERVDGDGEEPASVEASPLGQALAAERARRGPSSAVSAAELLPWLTLAELETLRGLIHGGRLLADGTRVLDGDAAAVAGRMMERGRRRRDLGIPSSSARWVGRRWVNGATCRRDADGCSCRDDALDLGSWEALG